jgi:hypothetical protein
LASNKRMLAYEIRVALGHGGSDLVTNRGRVLPLADFLSFAALKFDRTALAQAARASSSPPVTVIVLID